MSSSAGRAIRYTLFGESHGKGIGAVLDGIPAGVEIDEAAIKADLDRRRPGASRLATKRSEDDAAEILSGLRDGKTSGGPLSFLIRNADAHSSDYDPDVPRPSHADLPASIKHGPGVDLRGGGRFSGRLTAPLVAAGAVARQILGRRGVFSGGHILYLADVSDEPFDLSSGMGPDAAALGSFRGEYLPLINEGVRGAMETRIERARNDMDSVGGTVEIAVLGVPPGIGEPPFEGVESALAQWIFAVPAVKALEFGAGTGFARMRGSEANDPIVLRGGKAAPGSNRAGGANGGIANGNPIVFRATLRPTPSIGSPQRSVRLSSMTETELIVKGRHDPCVVPRAVPVLEAASLLCVLDLIAQAEGVAWMR
jgi:chorismate synthase